MERGILFFGYQANKWANSGGGSPAALPDHGSPSPEHCLILTVRLIFLFLVNRGPRLQDLSTIFGMLGIGLNLSSRMPGDNYASAALRRSRVKGARGKRTPVASETALAMAAEPDGSSFRRRQCPAARNGPAARRRPRLASR